MTHRIIIMGAPGAGKGTQAERIATHLGIHTLSTGDLFRKHISAGTELGELARTYIDNGDLVPDAVTLRMVREAADARGVVDGGFILDGFPRTVAQAEALEEMLKPLEITSVIELWVDPDEVVTRLLARAAIEGRSDDTAEVIRHRIDVYREKTRPLHEYYKERGLLREVNAVGDIAEITDRVLAELEG
ncbi:MAG TPA: adenylate kinase [Actinomycetaceae bacterium]|nr:adenylate kinase [Actinomycetaceae bacterium]